MSSAANKNLAVTTEDVHALFSDMLIPAADFLVHESFIHSGLPSVSEQVELPPEAEGEERVFISFTAFKFEDKDKQVWLNFSLAKTVEIKAGWAALAASAIEPAQFDTDDDEDDEVVGELNICDMLDDVEAQGEKVVAHTILDIDNKFFVTGREHDILRFVDGRLVGTFNTNAQPFQDGSEQDEELDDIISIFEETLQDHWDKGDLKLARFIVGALGLVLPRQSRKQID